jgi:hypothetical protein
VTIYTTVTISQSIPNWMKNVENVGRISFTLLSKVCTAPIFAELAVIERHYVKISCSKFHPNWSRNMEGRGRNSFLPLSKVWVSLSQCH